MADFGQELIEKVHQQLKVDEQWTTRFDRSFSWIGHRLEQTISSPAPIQDGEFTLYKLKAETVVVDSVSASETTVNQILSELNQHSFGNCYSFDKSESRICATTSTWIHKETAGWRSNMFDLYAIGQLCMAEAEADFLAKKCSGLVAIRKHPISGLREIPDDMLNVINDLIIPKGQEPSLYQDAFEFEAVADTAKTTDRVATLGSSAEGIALESSFDNYTAISVLSSTYKHRLLGSGLSIRLQIPTPFTQDDGFQISAMLNRHELNNGHIGGQGHIGAWCVDQGPTGTSAITYKSFLPNLVHLNGLIMDTSMACISRMRWVDQIMNQKPTKESAWKRLAKRFGNDTDEE